MRWFKLFAILVLLALVVSFAPKLAYAQGGDTTSQAKSPSILKRDAASPSFKDRNWKITRQESWQVKDPLTGVVHLHTTIFREAPAYKEQGLQRVPCLAGRAPLQVASCIDKGSVSRTDIDTLGGLTAHMVHYAEKWCQDTNCSLNILYQAYRVEIWWTRSNSSWDVRNATTNWGCAGCFRLCDDGSWFSNIYNDGPFTPTWSGNATLTRIYTSSNWPRLYDSSYGKVDAYNSSTAYLNGVSQGQMFLDVYY